MTNFKISVSTFKWLLALAFSVTLVACSSSNNDDKDSTAVNIIPAIDAKCGASSCVK